MRRRPYRSRSRRSWGMAYRPYGGRKVQTWQKVLLALLLACLVGFGALRGVIRGSSRTVLAAGEPQVMVIFGCKVEPDGPGPMLTDRLETACTYLAHHDEIEVVVAGGKGDDEHQSEAEAMAGYLTARGIEADRIHLEDQSRNTWQNVNYTLELMEQEGLSTDGGVVLVSSGFHLARIKLLWHRAGGGEPVSTLAAPVSSLGSKVQMYFREPMALVKSYCVDR